MKDSTRNLLVGLTVLVALVLFGAMALIFRELPPFLQFGHRLQVRVLSAAGAVAGTDVLLDGVRVGRIAEVNFTDDDARKGVTLSILINDEVNVPGDVNAYVHPKGLGTGAFLELRSDGLPPGAQRVNPKTGEPYHWLPKDEVMTIEGRIGDAGLIPPELAEELRGALSGIRMLVDRLNMLLAPAPAEVATATGATTATAPAPNLTRTFAKLDLALDNVNKIVGDPENQSNLKASLANLKAVSASALDAVGDVKALMSKASLTFDTVNETAKTASKNFDTLAGKLVDDADKLGQGLTELNKAIGKINAGEGTAGKLLNDPRLYNDLTESAGQLNKTLTQLQVLLEQWKAQGIRLNLK